MIPLIIAIACNTDKTNFDTDIPTDLSGEVDPSVIHPSCLEDASLIQETPEDGGYQQFSSQGFHRYTSIVAPNGGVIPIFAQNGVSDQQLLRARSLLKFFLTDVEGSTWGADKSEVANSMAANHASLMMPEGRHEEGNEPNLPSQPLYYSETPVEGSDWFMNNDTEHRDAAFEEIFHLVHDCGIGTYLPGALASYQVDLDSEARAAIEDGRWGIAIDPGVTEWIEELDRENSLAQEYIAAVIDSYYGLWGPWDEAAGGMWGIYIAKTRGEIMQSDPRGLDLLEQFLSPFYTSEVRLAAELDQNFSLTFDSSLPYTHKSQYFINATLTGSNSVDLIGNDQDNTLRGNSGDNHIDGRDGIDTFVLCNSQDSYSIEFEQEQLIINGVDGRNTLSDIEEVHFADGLVRIEELAN